MRKQATHFLLAICIILTGNLFFATGLAAEKEQSDVRESRMIIVKNKAGDIKTGTLAFVSRSEILVPVDVVKKYLNNDIMFDNEDKRVYVDIDKPDFKLETAELDELLQDGVLLNFLTTCINGTYYINMKNIEKIFNVKMQIDAKALTMDQVGKPTMDTRGKRLNKVREKWVPAGKINLVWDCIQDSSPDLAKEDTVEGLQVISPTWFSIGNSDGLVFSKADSKYVDDAHRKGYKVWALVNNSFNKDLTRGFLINEDAQDKAIRQLLVYSSAYNLDGINIDFENIYDEDRDRLTAFVGRLACALKQQNIIVSMDVTVPSNVSFWSKCYDRAKLAELLDYVMVMTYDEHWSKSPESGSVASFGWVKSGLEKTLAKVPREKLLLGLPFYTREWEETATEYGTVRVKAKTMSMAAIEETVRQNNLDVTWLEDKGQYYTEYTVGDKRYRIWIEDERSIALKAGLVDKYNLAGTAAWRKGFERKEIWSILNTVLQNKASEDSLNAKAAWAN